MTTSSNHCLRSLLPNSRKYLHGGRKALTAAVVATPLCISLAAAAGTCGNGPDAAPDNLRFVQYFLSRPQDMPACAMQVVNGRIVVPPPTTNAALACPDMFAWKIVCGSCHGRILEELGDRSGSVAGERLSGRPGIAAGAVR